MKQTKTGWRAALGHWGQGPLGQALQLAIRRNTDWQRAAMAGAILLGGHQGTPALADGRTIRRDQAAVIQRILKHCGRWEDPAARTPPGPAPPPPNQLILEL